MKRSAVGLVVAVVLLAAPARATWIRRLSLAQVESYASEIFTGTVRSVKCVRGPSGKIPVFTEVVFDHLDVLKGRITGATVTYSFAGGRLGRQRVEVLGVPAFEIGDRVVLFANARLDPVCPAIGWEQGRYRVERLAPWGEEMVCDSRGRPVYSFENGRPVLSPERKGERPMLLSAFRDRIEGLIRAREAREREREKGKAPPPEKKGGGR